LRRNNMIVEAKVTINASRAAVWNAITNIENAAEFIRLRLLKNRQPVS